MTVCSVCLAQINSVKWKCANWDVKMFRMTKSLCCIHRLCLAWSRHEYLSNISEGLHVFGVIQTRSWKMVSSSVLQIQVMFCADGLFVALCFRRLLPLRLWLQVWRQPWKQLRLLLWMLTFFTFIVFQHRLCRSFCFFRYFVKMNSVVWLSSFACFLIPSQCSTQLDFLFDQMLLLIFSVILWYYIIPVNQDCSKPGEASHRHSSHISVHRVVSTRLKKGGRSRVAAPWWLPSYQVSSEGDISL